MEKMMINNEADLDKTKDVIDEMELGKLVEKIAINVAGSAFLADKDPDDCYVNYEELANDLMSFSEALAIKILSRRRKTYLNIRSQYQFD